MVPRVPCGIGGRRVRPRRRRGGYAESHHCDAIALATRGLGGVQRVLFGSVADKVIRGAATPVLVVNPPAVGFSRVLSGELEEVGVAAAAPP